MRSLYDALGGDATVVELAVLTALRVADAGMPSDWSAGADHVLLDDEQLAAYWGRMLGGPRGGPYDGSRYLISPTAHDDGLAVWMLEECLERAAQETVVRSPQARAMLSAMVRWDLTEALDQLARSPLLPARQEVPLWGWEGPEDGESLERQAVLLQRLRAGVLAVLRPEDPPADTRLAWITAPTFGPSSLHGAYEWETALFLTVEVEGDSECRCWIPRPPMVDDDELDQVCSTVADWVSTDTAFGWGRAIPDPRR